MAGKWVDNDFYFGPNRRRRDVGKRWNERRQLDDAAEPPPLGALLRRLRVRLSAAPTPEERGHALQILNLAIVEAERQRFAACADLLKQAAQLVGANRFEAADVLVTEAMTHAMG